MTPDTGPLGHLLGCQPTTGRRRPPPPQLNTDPPPTIDAPAQSRPDDRPRTGPEQGLPPVPLGAGVEGGVEGIVTHPAQRSAHGAHKQQWEEGKLAAGIRQIDRVVPHIDVRMLRLRQRRQAGEGVAGQEAARGGVLPAGTRVDELGERDPSLAGVAQAALTRVHLLKNVTEMCRPRSGFPARPKYTLTRLHLLTDRFAAHPPSGPGPGKLFRQLLQPREKLGERVG